MARLRVDDIMVPRADIIALDEDMHRVSDVLQARLLMAGVSRIPLYSDTLDDPRGRGSRQGFASGDRQ
jgi:CBS domain containing-hemolysin-like protein